MKKRNLIAVLMMTAALAAGCGAKAETPQQRLTRRKRPRQKHAGRNHPERDNSV